MTIQELLTEYAEGARTYDVGRRALQIGRRRRIVARAVPVAAALAVVVAGGVTALAARPHALPGPVPPATSPVTVPTPDRLKPSDFPAKIEPQVDAPALPKTAGVGRGVWIYWYPDQDRQYLVTADGRQYRLDYGPLYQLSPNGRWLVGHVSDPKTGRTTLRDLTGVTTVEIPGGGPVWSPNGHWVATISTYIPGYSPVEDRTVRVVDLTDPGAPPASFTVPIGVSPQLLTDGGDVVVAVLSKTAGIFDLVVRQRLTGAPTHQVAVDYTPNLTPDELQATTEAISGGDAMVVGGWTVAVSDDRLLVPAMRISGNAIVNGPVVSIDLATGASTRAFVLTGATGEAWRLDRVLADGSLLLVHSRSDGQQVSLDRYDPTTRRRTQLTDLTGLIG